MSRGLSSSMRTAAAAVVVRPVLLADIQLTSGTIYVWSGVGNLTFNGHTYSGLGSFGGASGADEKTDLSATNMTLQLSGIPSSLISTALQEVYVNGVATMYFGLLDVSTSALISDPIIIFRGYTDVPTIHEGADTATINLTVENRLRALERPRIRQYTPEDQHLDYADDKGFDFVAALQDKQIVWK